MERIDQRQLTFISAFSPPNISRSKRLERKLFQLVSAASGQRAIWGKGRIIDAAWSSSGGLIAVGSALGVSIYNTQTLELECQISAPLPIRQVAFLSGDTLLAGASDESVSMWNVSDGSVLRTVVTYPQAPVCVVFSANAELIAVDTGETVDVYVLNNSELVCSLPVSTLGSGDTIVFSPDTCMIAISTRSTVQVWWIANQTLCSTFSQGTGQVTSMTFTSTGQTLITASDQDIQYWNTVDGTLLHTLPSGLSCIQCIATSHDDSFLVTASDKKIALWRLENRLPLQKFQTGQTRTIGLSFDCTNRYLLAVSSAELEVWQTHDWSPPFHLADHWNSISSVAIAADGQTFAAITGDQALWRTTNDQALEPLRFPVKRGTSHTSGIVFSPDHEYLAFATDTQIQVRRVCDGAPLALWNSGLGQTDAIVFSHDGQKLLTVSTEALHVWHMTADGPQHTMRQYVLGTHAVALAPDGETFATVTDRLIQIWNVEVETERGSVQVEEDVNTIAVTASGHMLAIASNDAIQLWQFDQSGQGEQRFTCGLGAQQIAFSSNAALLASTWNATIQVWNAYNGCLLHTFNGHTDTVTSIAFSDDGQTLISGSHDGSVRLWDC